MMTFPGGIEATANATLLFSLAAAVVYALILNTRETLLRSAVKTLAVALLAAAAMAVGARLLADDSPAMADPPKESGAEEGAHGEP
jgi:hypothetical protein